MKTLHDIKRGEVYVADLGKNIGSEQNGVRPVVVLQNDKGNVFSSNIIIACISTKTPKRLLPTHVTLSTEKYTTLESDSITLCDQMRTISKDRLISKAPILQLTQDDMQRIS